MSKNNEKLKLHIPEDFYNKFSKKHLLFDTCVFIDAMSHKQEFGDFFKNCKKNDITLVTIDPVVFEFTQGAENPDKLESKIKFISGIVDYILPINSDLFTKYIPSLILEYKENGKGLSITDLLLGATLQCHRVDLVLMTRNHSDFPLNIFNLRNNIVMEMRRSLQVYGIYGFSKGKS